MKKFVLFFFSFFLFIHIDTTIAQQFKKFSQKIEKYPQEIAEFMGKNIKKEDEAFIVEFVLKWNSGLYSEEEQNRIILVSNQLLKRKARSYPHFKNYLSTLMAFKKSNQDTESYNNWEEGILYMLNDKKITLSTLNKFLNITINLLSSNILHKSPSTEWRASSNSYRFKFDETIKIVFDETNLICYAKKDSIHILDTRGSFFPIKIIWKGHNGKVTWKRADFDEQKVFANLQNYKIDMKKSEYTADSVTLTNTNYFDQSLKGILKDKVTRISKPENATYPQFESYKKNFQIKNLYENIDYEGGLTIQGARLNGSGSQEKDVHLYILQMDTLLMTVSSNFFVFRNDRIISNNTSVTFFLEKDSIYHPEILFQYNVDKKEVTLLRTEDIMSQSPYFNSYHNVDMNFEQFTWQIGNPIVYFTMMRGSSIGNANFESANFFSLRKFNKIQGIDAINPLYSLKSFSQYFHSEEFTAPEFASYMKKAIYQVRHLLMRLSLMGFIYYNIITDEVKIKQRLYNYLDAREVKIDYDIIDFVSTTNAPLENAFLNLATFDLTINGIPRIFVSNSQNVIIIPENEKIILKRNRNFQFDGVVIAGLFTFYGNNLFFNYEDFKINLQNIDSLHIKVQTDQLDFYGNPIPIDVKNLIEHVTGELLIDKPDNKSGVKNNPEFPIFHSRENSFVYYEDPNIQNGVYSKNNFYFELFPYSIDSLDNFDKNNLQFEGNFVSAEIFPVFEEKLILQNDNSLGFIRSAPTKGFPVYNGKGTYFDIIKLSNKGLRGDGKLKYLTSFTDSDDFLFFPDSVNTDAQEFYVERQSTEVQFPFVESNDNYVQWFPLQDEMYLYRKSVPFTMYNEQTILYGTLKLEPSGLSGWGRMDLTNSQLNSNLFTYKEQSFDSDTSNFQLKALNKDGFTFLTDNVNAHIDFSTRKGLFSSNEDFTLVEFPENRYISYLDYFIWNMDNKELEMGLKNKEYGNPPTNERELSPTAIEDEQLTGAKFISIHPDQDSLSFVSPMAIYNYEKNLIKANEVKYIKVADAFIYPAKGKITVEEKAKIRTLENAKIITNNTLKYHTIHTAKIDIYSKNNYKGSGNYDYIDQTGKTQIIHFNEIFVDTAIQTIANGNILEPDSFTLSPNYAYIGEVQLNSNQKLLTFSGATKISHNCKGISKNWLAFSSEIDPNNIFIPVKSQPTDINKNKLCAGIFIANDSIHIYPSFFSRRKTYSDTYILTADGYLYYDDNSGKYKVSNKEKLMNQNLPGNYLSLHKDICNVYGEGKIDLGVDLGQLKLTTVGNINHNLEKNETKLDVMLALDFFISDKTINIMGGEIDSITTLSAVDMSRKTYTKGLAELIGAEKARDFTSEIGLLKELPNELVHTILLTDLKLKWDDETNSYRSYGKIGIGNIMNTQINKLVDGHLEIIKKRSGDTFDMFLKIDDETFYYFGYTRAVMQTLSSNLYYIESVKILKPNQRKINVKSGETSYIYMLAVDRKFRLFLRRFENE